MQPHACGLLMEGRLLSCMIAASVISCGTPHDEGYARGWGQEVRQPGSR